MSEQKTKVQAKPKLTPHLKRVIAEGEKAWREGNIIRVNKNDMLKFLRGLESNK